MKRSALFIVALGMFFVASTIVASAKDRGETAQPISKKTYTYE